MERKAHWERVYATHAAQSLSWFQETPTRSLELLRELPALSERQIIDVGGGDSTFVDVVVKERLGQMTVLDLSAAALARARERLGARAREVTWIEADITQIVLPAQAFDVWHDRAVFHFLTEDADRARYVATAAAALRSKGRLLIGTFAPDGPTRCSGLRVARYSAEELGDALGAAFRLERSLSETHKTPSGAEQRFTVAQFVRG